MSLSKEQWMAIEKSLSVPFGHAKLKCDGYEITAQVQQIGMKLVVAVFVDGRIKGAWLDGKDERCIKFYQCKKQLMLRGKMRASVMLKNNWTKKRKLYLNGIWRTLLSVGCHAGQAPRHSSAIFRKHALKLSSWSNHARRADRNRHKNNRLGVAKTTDNH